MNEKLLRLIILIFTVVLHLAIILFLAFDVDQTFYGSSESAGIMRLLDLEELPPPPPPEPEPLPPEPEIPVVEDIAEVMIETKVEPLQTVVAAGTLLTGDDQFLMQSNVETVPRFDERLLMSEIIYPPIAQRAGIEGRVVLELFVDNTGLVRRVIILFEEPKDRGFGESAVNAFTDRQGIPATVKGEPVSCRFRYPVMFRVR